MRPRRRRHGWDLNPQALSGGCFQNSRARPGCSTMAHDGIGSRRLQGCRGIRTPGFLHTREALSAGLSHTAMFSAGCRFRSFGEPQAPRPGFEPGTLRTGEYGIATRCSTKLCIPRHSNYQVGSEQATRDRSRRVTKRAGNDSTVHHEDPNPGSCPLHHHARGLRHTERHRK